MSDLAGKTALVTGASRGIGRASALALARAGAQAPVHYGRSPARLKRSSPKSGTRGGRAEQSRPISPPPTAPTTLPGRLAASSGIPSMFSLPRRASRSLRRSRRPRLRISTRCSQSTSASPDFLAQQRLPILGSGSSVVLLHHSPRMRRLGLLGVRCDQRRDRYAREALRFCPRRARRSRQRDSTGRGRDGHVELYETDAGRDRARDAGPQAYRPADDIGSAVAFPHRTMHAGFPGDTIRVDALQALSRHRQGYGARRRQHSTRAEAGLRSALPARSTTSSGLRPTHPFRRAASAGPSIGSPPSSSRRED